MTGTETETEGFEPETAAPDGMTRCTVTRISLINALRSLPDPLSPPGGVETCAEAADALLAHLSAVGDAYSRERTRDVAIQINGTLDWADCECRPADRCEHWASRAERRNTLAGAVADDLDEYGIGDVAAARADLERLRASSEAEVAGLRSRLDEYENAITWDASCLSCSRILDSATAETFRREAAEARLAGLAAQIRSAADEFETAVNPARDYQPAYVAGMRRAAEIISEPDQCAAAGDDPR